MIKWRQHLSFLPLMALAFLLGVASYAQEAWSCSWTCFWIPGTSLIRITGKKGTGLERLKINLSWSLQLQPWNRQELCEIWFRISWFLDLSLWQSLCLALRRRKGWAFPCRWPWVCAGFHRGGPWILRVLLSSNLSPEGEGRGALGNSTVWSGTGCFGVCGVCLGFSSFACLTSLEAKYLIPIYF